MTFVILLIGVIYANWLSYFNEIFEWRGLFGFLLFHIIFLFATISCGWMIIKAEETEKAREE